MTRMNTTLTLIAVLFLFGASYGGEQQSHIPKDMVKELQSLVGTWEVEGRIDDEKIEGTWSARWAPGKHCLLRQSSRSDGDQTSTGIGVIGWDAATERITEQVFFSNNESALLCWKVLSSGNWEGTLVGFGNGKEKECKVKMTKKRPGEFVYEEKTTDGEEIEAVLRKIPRKPTESAVPKAALEAMKYRVGQWKSDGSVDGQKVEEPGFEVTQWIAGRYAIRIKSSFVEDGVDMQAAGLVGWDADKKQLVEHWYASDGGYAEFRYDLNKQEDAWVGTFTWVYGDGRKLEGKSVVEIKSPDEWVWNASSTSDGEKHTWKIANHRVQ